MDSHISLTNIIASQLKTDNMLEPSQPFTDQTIKRTLKCPLK